MAEKHAYQMSPAIDTFVVLVWIMLTNQKIETIAIDKREDLRKYVYIYNDGDRFSELNIAFPAISFTTTF